MSGWIKLEKDLREDPRFTRMVDALIAAKGEAVTSVTQARYISNAAATQVLGSLAMLWMYADSHIREDDTLDIGADEVDQLVGLKGFTDLMPTDWLQVIDSHSVKLPGFHAHNGTEAKKKAQTQKRVARHRIREAVTPVAQEKRKSVTPALPDQTRPDQTKTRPDAQEGARELAPDFEQFLDATYPSTSHGRNLIDGVHRAQGLIGLGHLTEATLRQRLTGFRAFVDSGGYSGPHAVPSLRNWLDHNHPERYWARDWAAVPTKAQQQQDANLDASRRLLAGECAL